MHTDYIHLILFCAAGYLAGSIPFALVIGKLFYHTDIRGYGSGNLGGGNTGRVLGKRAGLAVMTLDLLKVSLIVFLGNFFFHDDLFIACGALAAGIGHCFPLFAGFRGGKAVAAMYGYLFGLAAFCSRGALYFLLPLIIFLLVLRLSRIIALASMISSAAACLYLWLLQEAAPIRLTVLCYTLLIVVRHRENIRRILLHNENTIRWM